VQEGVEEERGRTMMAGVEWKSLDRGRDAGACLVKGVGRIAKARVDDLKSDIFEQIPALNKPLFVLSPSSDEIQYSLFSVTEGAHFLVGQTWSLSFTRAKSNTSASHLIPNRNQSFQITKRSPNTTVVT
jgi:hypothetical protein